MFPLWYSNYPGSWHDHYVDSNYLEFDPLIAYAKRSKLPFVWGPDIGQVKLPAETQMILRESYDVGIRSGVGIPTHGPGGEYTMLLMSARDPDALPGLLDTSYNLLALTASVIYAAAARSLIPGNVIADVVLTRHEQQCLSWTAKGKTSWEISQILAKSKATVEYHLQGAMRKLGAATKAQAAANALQNGLL